MYTESIGERTTFNLAVPQQLGATATIYSSSADLSKSKRAFFRFVTGTFGGTTPTLSAALNIQVSADNSTFYDLATANNDNTTATVTTAGAEQGMEVRADQLAQQSAIDGRSYRYARLKAACTIGGTSPTIPVCMDSFQQDNNQGPGSQANASGVAAPLQVVSH